MAALQGRKEMKVRGLPGIYEGGLVGGEPEGVGEFRWNNEERYQGEWRAGKMEGRGTLFSFSGEVEKSGVWSKGSFLHE